jgi:hypothetical protein
MDDRIQNEQRMENATRIREGLDACRPGSSDLTSGDVTGSELELAAQALASNTEVRRDFERIGQWDAAIGKVMERVAIPAGLADRILVRLREGAERVSDVGLLQAGISAAIANSASEIEPVEAKYQVERAAGYDEPASQRWHVRNWSRGTLTIVCNSPQRFPSTCSPSGGAKGWEINGSRLRRLPAIFRCRSRCGAFRLSGSGSIVSRRRR